MVQLVSPLLFLVFLHSFASRMLLVPLLNWRIYEQELVSVL